MSGKQKLTDSWQRQTSINKKRIITCLFIFIFLIIALQMYQSRQSDIPQETAKKDLFKGLEAPEGVKERWLGLGEQRLLSLEEQNAKLQAELDRLRKQLNKKEIREKQENLSGRYGKSDKELLAEIDRALTGGTVRSRNEVVPPKPVPVYAPPKPVSVKRNKQRPQPAKKPVTTENQNKKQPEIKKIQPKRSKVISPATRRATRKQPEVKSQQITDEDTSFYVPTGAFFEITLLTGLDAPTGVKAQKAAAPVLMRVQDLSFLPNAVRQDIAGCFVLAEGYGELSSERALIRGQTLSCVDAGGGKVLDERLAGYVAGSDGKVGLRGKVVSKQGMFLAKTMQAAFLQGVAEGFQQSATTVVTTPEGTVSNPAGGLKDGFISGVSSGLSRSAEKLSDFYMSMAEEIFPVIEIGSLRSGTFVMTKGKSFSFDKKLLSHTKPKEAKNDDNL